MTLLLVRNPALDHGRGHTADGVQMNENREALAIGLRIASLAVEYGYTFPFYMLSSAPEPHVVS